VTGPGTLTFWWSNPSYDNRLAFSVGGVLQTFIILYSSWQQQTQYIGSGSQTLSWVYSVSTSPGDTYRGYVDQVSYTSGATAPLITSQPTDQTQVPGLDAVFTVTAGGTPPLWYQWQFNNQDIPGATNSSYTVTNVQAASLGTYSVVVSNSVDSLVSSNATLQLGEVTAWGSPAYGATQVPAGATNVLAVAAGNYDNLLLKGDGTLPCWGWNLRGETIVPADLTNAIAVAVGSGHCVALRPDGTVAAWGGQDFGETNVPPGLSNVVAIATAGLSEHSLALRSDGTLSGWGGRNGETNIPAGLSNVVAIAVGGGYDLAVKRDGTVITWGGYPPAVPTDLSNVVAVAGGGGFNLALLADGTVRGWGQNNYGQATVPTGLSNVVQVAAGDFHGLALLANGTVVAWGYNIAGQTNVPTGLTNVIAISAGCYHNLAQVGSGPPVLSAPVFLPTLSGSNFTLSVPSQCGRVYALEYMDDLGDPNWVPLPLVAGTGTDLVLLDSAASNVQRFYRVRRW
jgi:hypothetical protein